MKFYFFIPDIHKLATGGNIFNSHIIKELSGEHEVCRKIVPEVVHPEEIFTDFHEVPEKKAIIVFTDSILLKNNRFMTGLKSISKDYPVFLLVHYLELLDPSKSSMKQARQEKDYLPLFQGFVVTSQYSGKVLQSHGISPEQVAVIRPGLEITIPPDKKNFASPVNILTVSSLFPGKGLLEILSVLEKLSDLQWRWHLVGEDRLDPDFTARFRERVEQSSVRNRIKVHGPVDYRKMSDFYGENQIFLLPSFFESCSMVTMEAIAAGLPIVAYQTGGLKELIQSGRNGFLIPLNEKNAMERRLRTLITDSDLRENFGAFSLSLSSHFSGWDKAAEDLLRFLTAF
ncbi:MAG: glycosyltransferase family 4 protein [Calditrichaeota bacterium]|nr:glycosyltransferase family 4 protein [Calditrichota bacterium]